MNYINVGYIVKAHGIKGELAIKSVTDFNDLRFIPNSQLLIAYQEQLITVTLKTVRFHKGLYLITFQDYNSINEVLPFKGCYLQITSDQLPKLALDEYFYFELRNLKVYENQKLIGQVLQVINNKAHDLIIVKQNHQEIYIPFIKKYVTNVDLKRQIIEVQFIDELL